jgi:hypothetical protein
MKASRAKWTAPMPGKTSQQQVPPPQSKGDAQNRSPPMEDSMTLRTHLRALQNVGPERVFLVRKINRLGFDSPTTLGAHYSRYGTVENVLVAHSHVKSQNRHHAPRLRPSGLGFVVMSEKEAVDAILKEGPEQMIAGQRIRVHVFTRCSTENILKGESEDLLADDCIEGAAAEQAGPHQGA